MATAKKPTFDYTAAAQKSRETRVKQDITSVKKTEKAEASLSPSEPQLISARPVSPDNEYTEQVGVRVSKAMKKYLKQTALDHDTTVNDLIRNLISRAMRGEISIV